MIAAVGALLRADSTFMSTLPGGLYDSVDEVSRQKTPEAFDANKLLRPCALLKGGTVTRVGPVSRAAQQVFRLFLYERNGRASIEPARRRAFDLLHEQQVALGAGEGRVYEITHLDDVLDGSDDTLAIAPDYAALIVCRFQAVLMR